jgi:DNA-binding transcriptional ArsR family regulator
MKPNLSKFAELVADPSRGAMLTALLDGRFHPASELAVTAGIKPQTASFHLAKMSEAGIVNMEKHGRHRYYGISNPQVAEVLENWLSISPTENTRSFKEWREGESIRRARTCYDHLAGKIGVQLTQSLMTMNVIKKEDNQFILTTSGEKFLTEFGIDLAALRQKRRAFSRCCLDWSEREHHLAGALGFGILEQLFQRNWIKRIPGSRAIAVTDEGRNGFRDTFHISEA